MKHLWEIDHPYYCNEGNYFARFNEVCDEFNCLQDFLDEYANCDMEMNLLFRFDWAENTDEDREDDDSINVYSGDDTERTGKLKFFWMGQRKGLYRFSLVDVCRADESAVIEFLKPRWERMRLLWAPFSGAE